MRSAVALVMLAACWSERAASQPPVRVVETEPTVASRPAHVSDRCKTVVTKIYSVVCADSSSGRFPPGLLDELEPFSITNCREMEWSDETLDCYAAATSLDDSTACYRQMTSDQRTAFEKQFAEILTRFQSGGRP